MTDSREAEFWHPLHDNRVACDLCYRRCEIAEGGAGFCRIRVNRDGRLMATEFGVINPPYRRQNGYRRQGCMVFRAGIKSLAIGGRSCFASCSFCWVKSGALVHEQMTRKLNELPTVELGQTCGIVKTNPEQLVEYALRTGAQELSFTDNEPFVNFEFVYEAARLAKTAGLYVMLDHNGLATPEAIRKLAPFVDAVNIGIKGSGSPEFYARWMHAEGAVPHVVAAMRTWAERTSTLPFLI